MPDVALGTRVLDQGGGRAEGGEGEQGVLAGVLVGVVAAHCFWWCFGLGWFVLFCLVCFGGVVWGVGVNGWVVWYGWFGGGGGLG